MAGRRVDVRRTAAGVLAQADHVAAWLSAQPPSAWRRESALPGWTVAELATHITVSLRTVPLVLGRPTGDKPISVSAYVCGYAGAAGEILRRDVAGAAGRGPDEVLADVYAQREVAAAAFADLPTARAVQAPRGPVTPADYLVTRAIEMVVHADDLSRSLPDRDPVELDRDALRVVTQALAEVLATRAPGHSLELRVPPYAAVQAVKGPRHTRGTPPNVVQTDPLTWVRLAAGRLSWADAVAGPSVQASGERADLARWLPVL